MKRILAFALSVCLLTGLLVFPASAEADPSGTCGDNLTWTLYDDGELIIDGTGDMYDYTYSSSIGTSTAPWCQYSSSLKKLTLKEDVSSIGNYAFYRCTELTGNLVIPGSVASIGNYAFYYCGKFTGNLVISGNITSVGNYAFYGCSKFNGNLTLSDGVISIGNSAFASCSRFTGNLVIPDSVTSIGKSAFAACSGFTGTLTISDGVTSIGERSFNGCSGLTEITIPVSVTSIGKSAFAACSGFTGSLTIPDGVISIGEDSFNGCSGLTEITIPASVTSIDNCAFYGCSSITKVVIDTKNAAFGTYVFYNTHADFTVYGYTGSTAETYANNNTHSFVALEEPVTISFAGKLCAFMDSLYIRYYFKTDTDSENINYMGTLLMSVADFEAGGYNELTLDNATTNLVANNSADDQYASLGNFALQTVYAKDINTVYKVRPYLVLKDGTVVYGETEEYGLSVYLTNQINKPTSAAIYIELLNHILEYGEIMQRYINR